MKKYELTAEKIVNRFGVELFRIRALAAFATAAGDEINLGDLGGFLQSEKNLAHEGTAWVRGDAKVWGDAEVWGDAVVWGNAQVWGNAEVWGSAEVCGDAVVWGNAKVYGSAEVWGSAEVYGDAEVRGDAKVCGDAAVYGDAKVWGNAAVYGDAAVWGDAEVWGDAKVCGDASIFSTEHLLSVTPIGESANSVVFFRTKNREIFVSFEWNLYTLDAFEKLISNWPDKFKITARLAAEIAKAHLDLDAEDEKEH
jgi:carbonic anhydrase/acetyltransferase-like protein (isoleucine patch superfamily)